MAESNRDEIAKLEALYANNPDGRVFTHLAEAYRKAGELDRARDVLDRGLRRHADYASAHVVFGRVLADQGLETEAASSFQRVLQLDPENLIARRALAESDRAAGRLEGALVHYRELLAQDSSDEDVRAIVADLDARLHPPGATSSSAAWSSSHDEESWDAVPQEPISIDSTFGAAPEPAAASEPPLPLDEPLSLDSVSFGGALDAGGAFDLGMVDFGAGQTADDADIVLPGGSDEPASGAATSPEDVEPASADDFAEASGWGEWPGAAQAPGAGSVGASPRPVDESATPTDESAIPDAEAIAPPAGLEPASAADGASVEPSFDAGADVPPELEARASLEGFEPPRDQDVAVPSPEGLSVEGRPAAQDDAAAVERPVMDAAAPAGAPVSDASTPMTEPVPDDAWPGEPVAEAAAPDAGTDEPVAEAAAPDAETDEPAAEAAAHIGDVPGAEALAAESTPAALPREAMWERERHAANAEAPGMPTETLAALYRAQGFPDRAAAVYRELLRRRPGDAGLEERARAMEAEAEALRATQTGVEETRDVWVSGGADTWDADALVARAHAWDADDDAEDAGPSITEYFHQLLAWRSRELVERVEHVEHVDHVEHVEHDEPVERDEIGEALPFAFGEGARDQVEEPLPFAFDEGALDEIEEPLPFAFDVESDELDEIDDFAAPLPFVFEPASDEAGEEEPPRFAFESVVADEEATDSDEAVAFDFESMTAEAADAGEEVGTAFRFDDAPAAEAPSADFAFDDAPAGEAPSADFAFDDAPAAEPSAGGPPPAEVPEADPWAAPFSEPAGATAEVGDEHGGDEVLFLHEAEAVAESPAQEEVGWDPTVALADVVAPERPKPAPRPAAPTLPVLADEEEEDDDDDLEMFRSWLQSLKK